MQCLFLPVSLFKEKINDLKNSGNANFYKLENNTTINMDKLETRMSKNTDKLETKIDAVLLLQFPLLLIIDPFNQSIMKHRKAAFAEFLSFTLRGFAVVCRESCR